MPIFLPFSYNSCWVPMSEDYGANWLPARSTVVRRYAQSRNVPALYYLSKLVIQFFKIRRSIWYDVPGTFTVREGSSQKVGRPVASTSCAATDAAYRSAGSPHSQAKHWHLHFAVSCGKDTSSKHLANLDAEPEVCVRNLRTSKLAFKGMKTVSGGLTVPYQTCTLFH